MAQFVQYQKVRLYHDIVASFIRMYAKRKGTYILLFFFFLSFSLFSQTRYYVSKTGTATGNALSWATACNDLQLVINNAKDGDEIWVAQGTYKPIRPADSLWKIDSTDRRCAFVVDKNLNLYGGFAGTETNINQRNLPTRGSGDLTIISGDIGVQGDSTDNLFCLLIGIGQDSMLLDGFSFVHCQWYDKFYWRQILLYAKGQSYNLATSQTIVTFCSVLKLNHVTYRYNNTAHITREYVYITASIIANNYNPLYNSLILGTQLLHIENTTISDNGSSTRPFYEIIGGLNQKTVVLTNVSFERNVGSNGILFLYTQESYLNDVDFVDNTAPKGGGILFFPSDALENTCRYHFWNNLYFCGNRSTFGGAMCISNLLDDSVVIQMNNMLVVNNTSAYGGGIDCDVNPNSWIYINNSTIANNVGGLGGGITGFDSTFKNFYISNSIITGNIGHQWSYDSSQSYPHPDNVPTNSNISFSHCLVEGWGGYKGVILDTFPMFVDTANGNFHLLPNSPAINVGDMRYYSPDSFPDISWIRVDLDSLPRICEGEVDLGCYEVQGNVYPYLFVSRNDTICIGDTTNIPLTMIDTPPWTLIYSTSGGVSFDTIANIRNLPYYLRVNPSFTTTYVFYSVADSLSEAAIRDTLTVFVVQRPSIEMEDTVFLCSYSDKIDIYPEVANADRYLWNTGSFNKEITISESGKYILIASNQGCSVKDSVIAVQLIFDDVHLLTSGDVCLDGFMELKTNKKDVDYQWNTGETTSSIQIYKDGFYKVKAFSGNCFGEDSIEIFCDCKVKMYNFFAPVNSDDVYLPQVESALNSFEMLIYDRWGILVFKTDTYKGWNGNLTTGQPANAGVYYAIVNYTCQNNTKKVLTTQSSVTLVRGK